MCVCVSEYRLLYVKVYIFNVNAGALSIRLINDAVCEYVAAVPCYTMLLLFVLLDQNQLDCPGMSRPAHIEATRSLTYGYFALIVQHKTRTSAYNVSGCVCKL